MSKNDYITGGSDFLHSEVLKYVKEVKKTLKKLRKEWNELSAEKKAEVTEWSRNKKELKKVQNWERYQLFLGYKKNEYLPIMPTYIGECILKISKNIASRPNFSGYSYRHDMEMDGVEDCLKCLYKGAFDPKRGTAFALFTTIIWYAFLRRIEKERKQLFIQRKCVENTFPDMEDNNLDIVLSYKEYMDMTQDVDDFFTNKIKKAKETAKERKLNG